MEMYQKDTAQQNFFNSFFNKLAGNDELQQQIKAGKTEAEIRASWQPALNVYMEIRRKYLLYSDFPRYLNRE